MNHLCHLYDISRLRKRDVMGASQLDLVTLRVKT